MSKNRNETRKIELVETDNIARSLDRLYDGYSEYRWRRALYHAITMTNVGDHDMRVKIREALELP